MANWNDNPVAAADSRSNNPIEQVATELDGKLAIKGGRSDAERATDEQRARKHGWVEKTDYNYAAYQCTNTADPQWLANARVYEWNDNFGDVGPRVPALEKMLFNDEYAMRQGKHRGALDIEVVVEGPEKIMPIKTFDTAGMHPVIEENVKLCGYILPTPIQSYMLPIVNSGHDVVGISQTGSGKTAAYLIPVLSKLMGKADRLCAPKPSTSGSTFSDARMARMRAEPLVVIVVPTRELALQIFSEVCRMCYRSKLRPAVAYGGMPRKIMMEDLAKGCDILVATPGTLTKDLMDRPAVFSMSRVKYTIIDEADEMLNDDWQEDLKAIMEGGDTNEDADHLYMMFSATFPKTARSMARQYLAADHYRVRVGRPGQAHRNIAQDIIEVDSHRKREATLDLLMANEPCRTLIFCNSIKAVDHLDDFLYNRGLPTTSIHRDRNQLEREDAFRAFRTGKAPILISTGVGSRGWDIMGVGHVINYDLPSTEHGGINEYTHRIGRTGRIGNKGLATSFYNEERDSGLAQDLVNCLVECVCEVPPFLAHLKPEEGKIQFDDDSDDEAGGNKGGEHETTSTGNPDDEADGEHETASSTGIVDENGEANVWGASTTTEPEASDAAW